MARYCGSTVSIIDWDQVLKICIDSDSGDLNTVTSVVDRSEASSEGALLTSYRSIIDTWKKADYDLGDIFWYDYYPGIHFDMSVQDKFAEFVNAEPRRVFVSEVFPGRMVPYHWDVEDKEEQWLKEGSLKRWICFMDQPRWGSVLVLENQCFYNTEQGAVYEWNDYRSYHGAGVCGTHKQYLFHFLGKPND